jgi:hypothetical protein
MTAHRPQPTVARKNIVSQCTRFEYISRNLTIDFPYLNTYCFWFAIVV